MNEKDRRIIKSLFEAETQQIIDEVLSDPSMDDVKAPPEIHDNLFKLIHENQKRLSDEEKELIECGKIYRRRRKMSKYLVLIGAVVAVLAVGITSIGGAEMIFGNNSWKIGDRTQEIVNSGDTESVAYVDEEEVYGKIEEDYGFVPVRMMYLPEKVVFQEATIYDEIQGIQIAYGKEESVNIWYRIRPNYREGSYGNFVEDEMLEEYENIIEETVLYIKKYQVEEDTYRWTVQFEYQDVTYYMMIMNVEESEMEKIVDSLYFT